MRVEVAGPPRRLDVYVAWDDERRCGTWRASRAWGHGLAPPRGRARRRRTPALWCLRENARARGFYEHLGWTPTGREQAAEWPPYPVEMEYGR